MSGPWVGSFEDALGAILNWFGVKSSVTWCSCHCACWLLVTSHSSQQEQNCELLPALITGTICGLQAHVLKAGAGLYRAQQPLLLLPQAPGQGSYAAGEPALPESCAQMFCPRQGVPRIVYGHLFSRGHCLQARAKYRLNSQSTASAAGQSSDRQP